MNTITVVLLTLAALAVLAVWQATESETSAEYKERQADNTLADEEEAKAKKKEAKPDGR